MIKRPPAGPPPDEPDDDWDDDWQDPDERRVLGMTPRTAIWVVMAVGVGLAIIAIIVVAVLNSGKSNNEAVATNFPTSTLSAPDVPPGEVTCSVISADKNLAGRYTFVSAPMQLPDTTLPAVPPALQCTGTADHGKAPQIVALIWPNLAMDTYRQQLLGADWEYADQRGDVQFFQNHSSAYSIALLTVDDALVALYDQG
jgi:hypothetical protein